MSRSWQPWWEAVPEAALLAWLVELGTLRYAPAHRQRQRLPQLAAQACGWGAVPLASPGEELARELVRQTPEHPPASDAPLGRHWHWLQAALAHPEHRLVVYGTLAPGQCNHWVVEHIPGRWHPAAIRGHLDWCGRIPYLSWSPRHPELDVQVFCSPQLPQHWEAIDSFEGNAYRRVLIPAWIDGTRWPCYVYHARASWPPPGLNILPAEEI